MHYRVEGHRAQGQVGAGGIEKTVFCDNSTYFDLGYGFLIGESGTLRAFGELGQEDEAQA